MTTTEMPAVARPSARAAQSIFRVVLDALARPGTVSMLPVLPGFPPALAPLLALADLDTPICVLGDGAAERTACGVTSAPTAELPAARLVAVLRPVQRCELAAVRAGTAAAPEDAALVTLAVPALHGGPAHPLAGPGARGSLAVAGLPDGWVATRAAATFPAGADLLFVDPQGGCVGLPRSTRVGS